MDVFDIPATAHYIGGCVIGDSPQTGVVDPYQRVYGHPGLHAADGSAVTADLGVNPSLTITAQAERAMAFWPNRDEPETRPELGSPYRRIAGVPRASRGPRVGTGPRCGCRSSPCRPARRCGAATPRGGGGPHRLA